MVNKTYISIYFNSNSIYIFKKNIRFLGSYKFIQFRVNFENKTMIILGSNKNSFTTFRIPKNILNDNGYMAVHSKALCSILAYQFNWDKEYSYRVPGTLLSKQGIILFDLTRAEKIRDNNDKQGWVVVR